MAPQPSHGATVAAQEQPAPADAPQADTLRFELPPGPAGAAWASGGADAAPASLAQGVTEWARPQSWEQETSWRAWAQHVISARTEPSKRSELAAAALGHGRDEDAWEHFARAPDAAERRALLPLFLPGVAPDQLAPAHTSSGLRLADGAALSPRLPPLARPVGERLLGTGRLERREMKVLGLEIGAARVDVRVAIEPEGVQVDFDNVRGEPARCTVALPEPLDFELVSAYLDWERLERDARAPIEVRLSPGAATVSVYGRLAPRHVRWPSTLPNELEPRAQLHGFTLICSPKSVLCARASGFAAALEALSGLPGRCEQLGLGERGAHPQATRLDFSPAPDVERKFRALVSRAEAWALAR